MNNAPNSSASYEKQVAAHENDLTILDSRAYTVYEKAQRVCSDLGSRLPNVSILNTGIDEWLGLRTTGRSSSFEESGMDEWLRPSVDLLIEAVDPDRREFTYLGITLQGVNRRGEPDAIRYDLYFDENKRLVGPSGVYLHDVVVAQDHDSSSGSRLRKAGTGGAISEQSAFEDITKDMEADSGFAITKDDLLVLTKLLDEIYPFSH